MQRVQKLISERKVLGGDESSITKVGRIMRDRRDIDDTREEWNATRDIRGVADVVGNQKSHEVFFLTREKRSIEINRGEYQLRLSRCFHK